jgi:peroxidase
MAVFTRAVCLVLGIAVVVSVLAGAANGMLSPNFYSKSCPKLASIVWSGMASAVQTEKRMGASILRLFFHDCFVNVSLLSGLCHQIQM